MNPYLVLHVDPAADDAVIRRAYLEAVKTASPERAPKRFQEVSRAYEQIKDEPSRHRHALFDQTPPGESPLDTFGRWARARGQYQPLPFEALKTYLRSCLKI